MTTFSPSTVGSVATRMSSVRPTADAESVIRPSCGLRRSAMSSFASTLRRVVTPAAIFFGTALHLAENAVDAEAHRERVLLRLEVDVGGVLLRGLEDDRVDEPDERAVRDPVVGLEVVAVSRRRRRRVSTRDDRADRLGGSHEALELREDVVAGCDAELERVLRRESKLVDGVEVARDRPPRP